MMADDVDYAPADTKRTARVLKALANPHRLSILYFLADGERCVGELSELTGVRQPTLSQQLARLRAEDLVRTRRDAKRIFYSLASNEIRTMIGSLHGLVERASIPDRVPELRAVT
jgi:DNA-binding transcriptional ArsR family regulator